MKKICPKCQEVNKTNICSNCGYSLKDIEEKADEKAAYFFCNDKDDKKHILHTICPQCNYENEENSLYCKSCGFDLGVIFRVPDKTTAVVKSQVSAGKTEVKIIGGSRDGETVIVAADAIYS